MWMPEGRHSKYPHALEAKRNMTKPDIHDYEMWDAIYAMEGFEGIEDYLWDLNELQELKLRDELLAWMVAKGLVELV